MNKNELYRHSLRIYSDDTDCYGIVWHPLYLSYMSKARVEWLRSLELEISVLKRQDTLLVVRSASVEYQQAARLDDILEITVKVAQLKKASASFEHTICRQEDQVVIARGQVRLACTSLALKPRAWPAKLYEEMQRGS